MSKVLLINGSPHANGCTATALKEMIKVFNEEGVETELIQSFADVKEKYGYPEVETGELTCFADGK